MKANTMAIHNCCIHELTKSAECNTLQHVYLFRESSSNLLSFPMINTNNQTDALS